MQKGLTFENYLEVSYKFKYMFIIQHSNPTPTIVALGSYTKFLFTQKSEIECLIAALFIITKNCEWHRRLSVAEWINQKAVHLYNGIPLSNKKEQTASISSMDDHPGNYAERKKNNLKRLYTLWFHLYDILEKAKVQKGEQISDCQGFWLGEFDYKGATWQNWGG